MIKWYKPDEWTPWDGEFLLLEIQNQYEHRMHVSGWYSCENGWSILPSHIKLEDYRIIRWARYV